MTCFKSPGKWRGWNLNLSFCISIPHFPHHTIIPPPLLAWTHIHPMILGCSLSFNDRVVPNVGIWRRGQLGQECLLVSDTKWKTGRHLQGNIAQCSYFVTRRLYSWEVKDRLGRVSRTRKDFKNHVVEHLPLSLPFVFHLRNKNMMDQRELTRMTKRTHGRARAQIHVSLWIRDMAHSVIAFWPLRHSFHITKQATPTIL